MGTFAFVTPVMWTLSWLKTVFAQDVTIYAKLLRAGRYKIENAVGFHSFLVFSFLFELLLVELLLVGLIVILI